MSRLFKQKELKLTKPWLFVIAILFIYYGLFGKKNNSPAMYWRYFYFHYVLPHWCCQQVWLTTIFCHHLGSFIHSARQGRHPEVQHDSFFSTSTPSACKQRVHVYWDLKPTVNVVSVNDLKMSLLTTVKLIVWNP